MRNEYFESFLRNPQEFTAEEKSGARFMEEAEINYLQDKLEIEMDCDWYEALRAIITLRMQVKRLKEAQYLIFCLKN